MKAYIYQAALLCEDCGANVSRNHLDTAVTCRHGNLRQDCQDSDCTPQGPYADGGGESDSPQHCDHCGVFLENPLTRDGENFVLHAVKVTARKDSGPIEEWRIYYSYLFRDTAETCEC